MGWNEFIAAQNEAKQANRSRLEPQEFSTGFEVYQASPEEKAQSAAYLQSLSAPTIASNDAATRQRGMDALNRGFVGGTIGAPVDLTNEGLRLVGLNTDKPFMGSEWWGDRMQGAGMVSANRDPIAEAAASFIDPLSAGHGVQALAGIFAGKGAKLADLAKMDEARTMLAKGVEPATVWKETGWGKGPDGHWRFEIPDDNAVATWRDHFKEMGRLRDSDPKAYKSLDKYDSMPTDSMTERQKVNMSKLLEKHDIWPYERPNANAAIKHEEMFAQYPDLKGISAEWVGKDYGRMNGEYSNGGITLRGVQPGDNGRSTLLHELQHAIQDREGFARGGSPSTPYEGNQRTEFAQSLFKEMRSNPANANDSDEAIFNHALKIADSDMGREKAYKRLAGEAEARLTQARMQLSGEQRANRYPWEPEYFKGATGVDVDKLIYRDASPVEAMSVNRVNLSNVPGFMQDRNIEYLTNPKQKELERYLQTKRMEYQEKGWNAEDPIRYIVDDKTGDAHFFDANDMMHQDMAEALGISKLDQGFIKGRNGEKQIGFMFNDPYFSERFPGWAESLGKQ